MNDQVIVVGALLVMLFALVREWTRPVVIFLLGLCFFVVTGVIGPKEAFAGFSNEVLIIIGSLYVVTAVIEQTTGIESLIHKLMGNSKSTRKSLLRMMLPVTFLSGFANNTPIVSMLLPQVGKWASVHKVPASYFLMPLSFASILGGVLTLIGTSTNLAISGLLVESGLRPLGFFELTIVGLPIAIIGTILIVLQAPKVLPKRTSVFDDEEKQTKKFIFKAQVEKELDGQTVQQAGLRNLPAAYMFAIERGGEVMTPVRPNARIHTGDILVFTGQANAVKLVDKQRGLRAVGVKHIDSLSNQTELAYHEVIIDNSSPLVGITLKQAGFRGKYEAAVLAIHRAGEKLDKKLGSIKLRAGDTLLVVADDQFSKRWSRRRDFLAVFPLNIRHIKQSYHGNIAIAVVASSLLLAILGITDLSVALLLAASLLIAFKVTTFTDAVRSIEFEILLLIGAAFGVAAAASASGVADNVAGYLVETFGAFGPTGVLAGIVLATVLLTEMITNSAAALLMLPIALSAANSINVDPIMMAIAVAVSASASFLTPVGYQTNTMVYGPGGYKFTDFMRLGWLPSATVIGVLLLIIPRVW